jgi:hypothetical protein
MAESSGSRFHAMDIHRAVDDLEEAHRRITAIIESFPRTPQEEELSSEIDRDIDRAVAKLRFYFTTLESAGQALRYALECEWGECPSPE